LTSRLARRRQTLERKARFISQVIRGRLDAREIGDIGDTALSYSEVKALATGNPLLMDKAEADAALARLQRSERAHARNQNALTHAITRHEQDITRLTALICDIDAASSCASIGSCTSWRAGSIAAGRKTAPSARSTCRRSWPR
jgi:hypothetical protein